ncbi:hypothetical protein ACFXHA_01695 [Nocardia sp. NPDC059240]|uniref:hypothetical protein n=1 Tax=Nocardia sp. NPDC059240 TaxID=3346786 RepID=UPI003686F8EE
MRSRSRVLIAGILLAGPLAVTGCSSTPASAPAPAAKPSAGPRVVEPPAAAVSVTPGEVRLTPGPFTDRVRLSGTRLDGATVHGTLAVTSDVSDLLALEVRADFYDASGHLVGSGRFERADGESAAGSHAGNGHVAGDDGIAFTITAAPADAAVAAAVLSIPVLVNE